MRSLTCELIKEVVDLIERNLKRPLSLDLLSQSLFVSKYHLNRLFKAMTMESMMAYVRGRRLSQSLQELNGTQSRIVDIAQEYCFGYEQSYERAFKKQFGITPSEFRNIPCELNIIPVYNIHSDMDLGDGVILHPRFLILPTLYLAGLRSLIDAEEDKVYFLTNKAAISFNSEHKPKISGCVNEHIYYGITFLTENPRKIHYMSCVEVTEPDEIEQPFEVLKLTGRYYAVFKYVGFHSVDILSAKHLDQIYEYIDTEWYEKTGYKRNGDYYIERLDLSLCSSCYCEADIFAPVAGF